MRAGIPLVVVVFLVAIAGCSAVFPGEPTDDALGTDGSPATPTPTDPETETTGPATGATPGEATAETDVEGEEPTPTTTEAEPTPRDSDGDGLTDRSEREEYGTDPETADTDGDGLDDRQEVAEYDTNATLADTDGDGLADGPEVDEHGTDPTVADTDGDSLSDGREVSELGTDPTAQDTDGDGLSDDEEVTTYGTNATLADTDGDGLDDGIETNETIRAEYLPGADPTHKNLYLDIEYRDDCGAIDGDELGEVESTFESAPVSNPDGESGIDLTITEGRNATSGYGYYGGEIVESLPIRSDENIIGVWRPGNTFWVECRAPDDVLASVVMHELGHALGLNPLTSDEDGIDSREKSFDEYESVMNYNSPARYLGYSAGDWETVAENMDLYVSTRRLESE